MTVSGIIRLLASFALLAGLAVTISACEGDSPEPTAAPVQAPQFAPTPFIIFVSTPVPTNTPSAAPTATPPLPSAVEILREATAAMKTVRSGHLEMDTTSAFDGENGFTAEINVSGDFQLPDRTQATMAVKTQGFTVELEFISIGVESYIKNPLTGEWEANIDATNSLHDFLAAPAFNTDFPADSAGQFELLGVESLEGERVYHLRATMPGPDLVELVEGQGLFDAEGEVSYWIGVDDYLVRKVEVLSEQGADDVDSITTQIVIVLSDYNSNVEIVAPEAEAR